MSRTLGERNGKGLILSEIIDHIQFFKIHSTEVQKRGESSKYFISPLEMCNAHCA